MKINQCRIWQVCKEKNVLNGYTLIDVLVFFEEGGGVEWSSVNFVLRHSKTGWSLWDATNISIALKKENDV